MSEQALNITEWDQVKQAFKNHFEPENVKVEENSVEYVRTGEHLRIEKDGTVSGAMPLHDSEFSGVEKIVFRDSEVELKSDEFSYTFRR